MRMLRPGIHLQVTQLSGTQTRAGKHALDSFFDDEFGLFLEVLRRSGYPHAPGIARMADILLVRKLVAGQLHLLGVDNDDVVATIDVRSEPRLVLAAQNLRDLRCETAQYRVRRVDQHPLLVDVGGVGGDRLVAQ